MGIFSYPGEELFFFFPSAFEAIRDKDRDHDGNYKGKSSPKVLRHFSVAVQANCVKIWRLWRLKPDAGVTLKYLSENWRNQIPEPDRLLFVDTNIWLDFYRSRTEAGLNLLKHLDVIKDRIIMTYQVEIEFKKNRQKVIQESFNALKPPTKIDPPRIFSDAKKTIALSKDIKDAERHVKALKERFQRALINPTRSDPVYKICQRCFHKNDETTLSRNTGTKRSIKRRAFRRFL